MAEDISAANDGVFEPGRDADSAGSEWRQYWPVVLIGVLGMAMTTVHLYSTGVFIGPLEEEFGWSRSEITFGFTILALVGAVLAPFVGALIDRYGPRRLGLAGIAVYCLCLAGLSLANANIYSWWALWCVLAVGGLMTKPTIWTAAVSSLFQRGRGLALAFTLCGTGIGSSFVPALANSLITHWGWREAYITLAVICLLIVLPVAVFGLHSASDNARRQRARSKTPVGDARQVAVQPGLSAKQAILSLRFLKLAVAAFTVTLAIVSFVMNLVPIMVSNGFSRETAAGIAGLVGVTSIAGRLVTGHLLDRLNGNLIGAVVVLAPIFTCLCFIFSPTSTAVIVIAVIVLGLALGAELDVVAYLATRHFGLRSYGVIFGTIVSLWSVANGLGPLGVSYIYDLTGSYEGALWIYIPLLIIASASLYAMGDYPESFEKA